MFFEEKVDSAEVDRVRVELLYKQSALAQMVGLVNAAVFCMISRDSVDRRLLISWFVFTVAVYSLRMTTQVWIRSKVIHRHRPFDPRVLENIFACGNLLGGLAWSIAGTWLLPSGESAIQGFFAFIVAGTTAGACVAYSMSLRAIQAFLFPSVFPFAVKLILEGGTLHYTMAALIVWYAIAITAAILRVKGTVIESIRLRFENELILKDLRDAHGKITYSAKMAALGEMAGGISHEINTPLGGMQLQLARLSTETNGLPNSPMIGSIVGSLTQNVERIGQLITGLKSFAREAPSEAIEPAQLNQIVERTLDFCRSRFQNNGIELKVEPIPNVWIFCSGMQISQVLLNLLNNAFDAVNGRASGLVHLAIEDKRTEIRLIVGDNGPGVPPEIRDKIVQPFFTTKEPGKGTGLGLSVANGIVQAHGGRLQFESTKYGSRFIVSLPKDSALNAS